jgi:hypothetical protein
MTSYLSEDLALLAVIYPAVHSTEQNTTWVSMSNYEEIAVVLIAGDIGTSLDLDIEIATDGSAGNLHTLKSITQLTQAGGDDNSPVLVEVLAAEMVNPSGASGSNYDYLRVEATPSGNCYFSVAVFGHRPRQRPVATTLWDEVKQ